MTGMHVRVHAGGEQYAIPIGEALEVADMGDVVAVPGAPGSVIGIRNLRGQVLPVIDLAALLGLEATAPRGRIVVAAEGPRRAGLAVESIIGVASLAAPSQSVDSDLLAGAVLVDGTLVGIVKVAAAFDAATAEGSR